MVSQPPILAIISQAVVKTANYIQNPSIAVSQSCCHQLDLQLDEKGSHNCGASCSIQFNLLRLKLDLIQIAASQVENHFLHCHCSLSKHSPHDLFALEGFSQLWRQLLDSIQIAAQAASQAGNLEWLTSYTVIALFASSPSHDL